VRKSWWLFVVVGALSYAAGVEVARTQDAKMVHDALLAADGCHEELMAAEETIDTVAPILQRLWPGNEPGDWRDEVVRARARK
jgi:hypothetical protein